MRAGPISSRATGSPTPIDRSLTCAPSSGSWPSRTARSSAGRSPHGSRRYLALPVRVRPRPGRTRGPGLRRLRREPRGRLIERVRACADAYLDRCSSAPCGRAGGRRRALRNVRRWSCGDAPIASRRPKGLAELETARRGGAPMPLHQRAVVRDDLDSCVYPGQDLSRGMPKYAFPEHESEADDASQVVHDELMLDGNARQNLATFCQTWEEQQVHDLMNLSIDKNMIDKDEYPQTAELERRCVHMLADLWHAPHAANTVGTSAIGSSEACMLGAWRPSGVGAPSGRRGVAHRPAEHGVRSGAGGLAQVRPLLGHRDARGPDVGEPLLHDARRHAGTRRREHDRGGADVRRHLHRCVRRRGGDEFGARRVAGADRTRRRHSRRWCERSVPSALLRARARVRLPRRGSNRSARRDTSSGSRRSASAGWCGATQRSCPTS